MDLQLVDADELPLHPPRLARLQARLQAAVDAGEAPGISLAIAREGKVAALCAGRVAVERAARLVTPETVFLIASVTKPVVAAAALLLVERGQLMLDQPVCDVIPEFAGRGKEPVTLRHLLTHTSGLPDMLPDNQALREQHAPLGEFERRVFGLSLDFPAGTRVQYQSMGFAALGAVIGRVDGRPLPLLLKEEFFQPLEMDASCLGLEDRLVDRIARSDLSIPGAGSDLGGRETDWGWNSDYWRRFGAPWGGMFATPTDLCRFLQMFANEGKWGDRQILAPATVRAMTRRQTDELSDLPESERRRQAWGLGWGLARGRIDHPFGDLLALSSYGHAGATGTVVWNDPASGLSAAIFCNRPLAQSRRLLHQCSSLIAAATLNE
jgi:CubicO group peptidase (beta-lactamase class C family)